MGTPIVQEPRVHEPAAQEPAPQEPPRSELGLKPGTAPLSALRTPSPLAIVGGSLRLQPSTAPSKPSSRPPSPKSVAPPAGGPPVQYERAFRQWSEAPSRPPEVASAEPVTFQVYTTEDIAKGRGPMRSLVAAEPVRKKSSLLVRLGLGLLGLGVVAFTTLAVIAVSTEEPHAPPPPVAKAVTPPPVPEPPAAPSVITIGDPIEELPATPAPSAMPSAAPAPTPVIAKPRPRTSVAPPPPPAASLQKFAPPPNPYGK
jgi:flagellar protein FliO/FliZ